MFNFAISIVTSVLLIQQADFSTGCFQQHVSYWLLQQFWLNPSQYQANAKLPLARQNPQAKFTSYWTVEQTFTSATMPRYSYGSMHTETSKSLSLQSRPEKHYPFKQLGTFNSSCFCPMELIPHNSSRMYTSWQGTFFRHVMTQRSPNTESWVERNHGVRSDDGRPRCRRPSVGVRAHSLMVCP